jgi:threonine dehydrogenase-like Zn-dependent dehydrogenase
VISEPNAGRAALMASLGFEVLDPTATDVAKACRERREGGFEVVVECSGHPAGLTTGLDAVAPGGCVVQAGIIERPVGGRVPLADAVSGFERLTAGDGAVKVIVDVA